MAHWPFLLLTDSARNIFVPQRTSLTVHKEYKQCEATAGVQYSHIDRKVMWVTLAPAANALARGRRHAARR